MGYVFGYRFDFRAGILRASWHSYELHHMKIRNVVAHVYYLFRIDMVQFYIFLKSFDFIRSCQMDVCNSKIPQPDSNAFIISARNYAYMIPAFYSSFHGKSGADIHDPEHFACWGNMYRAVRQYAVNVKNKSSDVV